MKILVVLISLSFFYTYNSCNKGAQETTAVVSEAKSEVTKVEPPSSYDYAAPDQVMVLDRSLREISSLTYQPDGDYLITNNDESGIYFRLQRSNGSLVDQTKFGKKGDYEAITYLAGKVIVAKKNGTLYIHDPKTDETDRQKTKFTSDNDIEGLAYDTTTRKLLMACKSRGLAVDSPKKDQKCVYEYDLEKRELDTIPFLSILDKDLKAFVTKHYDLSSKAALEGKVKRIKDFAPSGIAIHPKTQEYYLISARESTIVRVGRDKKIKEIGFFRESTIPQPEGITFGPDGDLYVAGEGKDVSGKIFRFRPR